MNKIDLINALRDTRFLHAIDAAHLQQLADMAEVCEFNERDVVFREGQPAEEVYFVLSGKVSLHVGTAQHGRKHIIDVGPGEMLGWSSLSDHPQFAATGTAIGPTTMIRIDALRLQAICDSDPEFGYEFMRRNALTLAKRLTATWSQLAEAELAHNMPITVATAQND